MISAGTAGFFIMPAAALDTDLRRYDEKKERDRHPGAGQDPLPRSDYLQTIVFSFTLNSMKSGGYVYIMASAPMGTIYIGSTSNLVGRVWEHKNRKYPNSFTAKYHCDKLVYYEYYRNLTDMVSRERQLKNWHRNWKMRIIIQQNPDWIDLYPKILEANGYSEN